jgi:ketosteroid isomerase-like protein
MFDAASLFFAETIMASSKAKPAPKKTADARDIVRAVFKAYEKKDRAAIEAVLADDFHFTSPLDNRLDREAYFRICWPGSRNTERFKLVNLVADGNKAFVTYEAVISGKAPAQHRGAYHPAREDRRSRSLFRLVDPA